MKTVIKSSVILSLLLIFYQLNSNPIAVPFITELKIDSSDFSVEIHANDFWGETFDGWYLTSLSDTVAIDSGIALIDSNYNIIHEYVVLTQDSLMDDFQINPQDDEIGLGFYRTTTDSILEFKPVEIICFGDGSNSVICAPRSSQTICLSEDFMYYLDNSPTLCMENDTDGAIGYLDGFVIDSSGNPQSNFTFIYAYSKYHYYNVTTNQNGYFIIESIATRIFLHLEENGKIGAYLMTQQIYPEDTIQVAVNKDNFTGLEDDDYKPVIQNFKLKQNYPNPFNIQTTFSYFLPLSDFIEISIFDISGKKIKTLISGYRDKGHHKINWNAAHYASGIYIYKLNTSQGALIRKCILIK
jgi:hypothetical protein